MPTNTTIDLKTDRAALLAAMREVIEDADGDVGLILTEADASDRLAERIMQALEDFEPVEKITTTPALLRVRVEYDLEYVGGNYDQVGESITLLAADDEPATVNAAFKAATGYDPIHIVQYSEADKIAPDDDILAVDDLSHAGDCPHRLHSAAECLCYKSDPDICPRCYNNGGNARNTAVLEGPIHECYDCGQNYRVSADLTEEANNEDA